MVGRALDNRTGTFSVAEAFRQLTDFKSEITAEVCAVSNVMEEIGLFGARQIAHSLEPDAAIVTDVTHATDYPSVDKAKHGDIKLGSGPTLTRRGCNHPIVVQRLEAAAKSAEKLNSNMKQPPIQREPIPMRSSGLAVAFLRR